MKKMIRLLFALLLSAGLVSAQEIPVVDAIPAEVDFSVHLQEWDGFGFNYVETSQTLDYEKDPQDYGGFSILDEKQKTEIIEAVFGEEGLKVGLVKMFLDPWHQSSPDAEFDHKTTTANMREFVKLGYAKTKERDADLQIITTLYGPPAWATKQKFLRGRDLDPEMKDELARYMVDWAHFLKVEEGLPVKYISLHNEGEDWQRWPRDGKESYIGTGHDYNLWWPPHQVVDFVNRIPAMIDEYKLADVKVANGECSTWYRFSHWGEAWAIAEDATAWKNLGLITSHGFWDGDYWYWYGDHNPFGINLIKQKRPDIHAWTTSSSWANMDAHFVRQIYGSIYSLGINGYIPWAAIQRPPLWVSGDPNPGNAIQVNEDGTYALRDGYYYYKQVTVAGQPGMKVAKTISRDTEIPIMAFDSDDTNHPDAFVVINMKLNDWQISGFSIELDKKIEIEVKGTSSTRFKAYRTHGADEKYKYIGDFTVENGRIQYTAPKESVTTFIAVN